MKIIIYYECEICRRRYDHATHAEECEAKGVPVPPPPGMLLGDHRPDAMYHDITFCIPDIDSRRVIDRHWLIDCKWATRDSPYGDSLGDSTCGGGNYFKLTEYDGHLNPEHITFRRMVKWLRKARPHLDITVWNGTKIVPLDEYIANYQPPAEDAA